MRLVHRARSYKKIKIKIEITFTGPKIILMNEMYPYLCISLKGQLQRFHKLISNDRIWPSEHGFEVIFEKSLFVFEISAFKVRN